MSRLAVTPLRLETRDYPKEHQGWLGKLFGSLNGWLGEATGALNASSMEIVAIVVDPDNLPVSVSLTSGTRVPAAVLLGSVLTSAGGAVGAAVHHVPPLHEWQQVIQPVFARVLGLQNVGINLCSGNKDSAGGWLGQRRTSAPPAGLRTAP